MSGSEWQPIETYPEGRYVIFRLPKGETGRPAAVMGMAWRYDGLLCPWTEGGPNSGLEFDFPTQPTHWMEPPLDIDGTRFTSAPEQSDPGIPIYRTEQGPTETFEMTERRANCVTCSQSFDLQDPEQLAYHDQEGEHPPMK